MSTVLKKKRPGAIGQDYMAFFANPYSALRTLIMVLGEIVREIYQQTAQVRRDIQPRVHRGWFPYPLLRAFTNVLQRELGMSATIQDIYAGRPVIYSMFLGYDEVAHHSGTERAETLRELEKIDKALGRLEHALADAPRKYEVIVLADHGQTQGATFKQRYGLSLEELTADFARAATQLSANGDEGKAYIHAANAEMQKAGGMLSAIAKLTLRSKHKEALLDDASIVVMPSGALGTVSFTNINERASLEWIEDTYPELIKNLINHEGIGFILVESDKNGAVAIGKNGRHHLSTGKISGNDPLAGFGPNAADHVRRTSSFPHCPDLVINSTFWTDTAEVAAFEELVGSHGAMGGPQQYPFVLYPTSLKQPKKEIVGAENVHRLFKTWLAGLGWDSYRN